jgi:hypothetical protein
VIPTEQVAEAAHLPITWWSLAAAAFFGGLVVKILEYLISWLKHFVKERKRC